MKSENVIRDKSFEFALRIVKAYKYLCEKKEYVLSKQLLKSGTSIGANIEESQGGQSRPDFISKTAIAYKEARETIYWFKLLSASDYLNKEESKSLLDDAKEITRILAKIQLTSKKNDEAKLSKAKMK